jgi:hypothetical protein
MNSRRQFLLGSLGIALSLFLFKKEAYASILNNENINNENINNEYDNFITEFYSNTVDEEIDRWFSLYNIEEGDYRGNIKLIYNCNDCWACDLPCCSIKDVNLGVKDKLCPLKIYDEDKDKELISQYIEYSPNLKSTIEYISNSKKEGVDIVSRILILNPVSCYGCSVKCNQRKNNADIGIPKSCSLKIMNREDIEMVRPYLRYQWNREKRIKIYNIVINYSDKMNNLLK